MKQTHIPEGDYLTKAQIAEQRGAIPSAVQHWLDHSWLPSIQIPGLGHIINVKDLEHFEPPRPGPKGPHRENPQRDTQPVHAPGRKRTDAQTA